MGGARCWDGPWVLTVVGWIHRGSRRGHEPGKEPPRHTDCDVTYGLRSTEIGFELWGCRDQNWVTRPVSTGNMVLFVAQSRLWALIAKPEPSVACRRGAGAAVLGRQPPTARPPRLEDPSGLSARLAAPDTDYDHQPPDSQQTHITDVLGHAKWRKGPFGGHRPVLEEHVVTGPPHESQRRTANANVSCTAGDRALHSSGTDAVHLNQLLSRPHRNSWPALAGRDCRGARGGRPPRRANREDHPEGTGEGCSTTITVHAADSNRTRRYAFMDRHRGLARRGENKAPGSNKLGVFGPRTGRNTP